MLAELRTLLRLGLPAIFGQIGMMLLHAVDTVMLGHYGVLELGAAALGTQWIFLCLTVGMGLVMGIDPLVAQLHGAGDKPGTGRALQHGLILAFFASLVISVAWLFTGPLLRLTGQDPELCDLAHTYVAVQLPSIFPFLGFVALRSFLQGREIVAPAMWVMLPVNLINLLFNWLLIFGPSVFPEWGLLGAALSTCISRSLMGVLLLVWIVFGRLADGAWEPFDFLRRARLTELKKPFFLGLPIALQMGFEVLAFVLAALVAGWFGPPALAGHSIVLSFAGLIFMIPLGVASGTTTRVGNLIGAGKRAELNVAMRATALLTAGVVAFNVIVLLLGGRFIASFYTEDPLVQAIAGGTFVVAAAFQASDCAQVVTGGALRGMGRTRSPAIAAFVGYYVFGIPCGYFWGVVQKRGLPGLWWGLALGLTVVAVTLVTRLVLLLREGAREQALVPQSSKAGAL